MGIIQNGVVLDQNQRANNLAMHSEFRYHSENYRHRENLNFFYAQ